MPGQAGRRPTVTEQKVTKSHLLPQIQPCNTTMLLLINTNGPEPMLCFVSKYQQLCEKK